MPAVRIKRRASGLAGAPASLLNAELAFNEVDNVLYYGKGESGGVATTIIPIGGEGAFLPLNGSPALVDTTVTFAGGVISLNNIQISDTPNQANHAATKGYVDSVVQGLDVKESVRCATTANITTSGLLTIDGITVVAGNRVLVKNQTTASQNGIYITASGAWTRAADFVQGTVSGGAFTFVEEGSTNANTGWVLTNNGAITIGTTALTFSLFSSAGIVTAGAGLTMSGSTISMTNMAVNTIKGRATAGTGVPEDLTAAQVRTILNVENGANAYVHPTQTAISHTAATGMVLSGITVNTLGHTTAVATKTLAEADIPSLNASKIGAGTLAVARLDATVVRTNANFDISGIYSFGTGGYRVRDAMGNNHTTFTVANNEGAVDRTIVFPDASGTVELVGHLHDAANVSSGRFILDRLPTSATANTFLRVGTANSSPVYAALIAADIPNLDATKINSGSFDAARIPTLDAAKIGTGTLDVARIPNLDTGKITTGTFVDARIPSLDAAKITTGRFVFDRLPTTATANTFLKVGTANSSPAYTALVAADIPVLDTTKITTGTFDAARIPNLSATKITTDRLTLDRLPTSATAERILKVGTANSSPVWTTLVATDIPVLDAAKITTGTFADARIPALATTKITSGTFDVARIPNLSATKITSDRLILDRLPTSVTANRFLKVTTASSSPQYLEILDADLPTIDGGTF